MAVPLATTWALTATTAHFAINLAVTYAAAIAIVLIWARDRRSTAFRCIAITVTLVMCVAILEIPAAMRWMDYRLVFRLFGSVLREDIRSGGALKEFLEKKIPIVTTATAGM